MIARSYTIFGIYHNILQYAEIQTINIKRRFHALGTKMWIFITQKLALDLLFGRAKPFLNCSQILTWKRRNSWLVKLHFCQLLSVGKICTISEKMVAFKKLGMYGKFWPRWIPFCSISRTNFLSDLNRVLLWTHRLLLSELFEKCDFKNVERNCKYKIGLTGVAAIHH